MSKFKVGDAIVGQNFDYVTYYNGAEGEVIEVLAIKETIGRQSKKKQCGNHYTVLWDNGKREAQIEFRLRKKKPPQEKSTWEEFERETKCNWNPLKVKV